MAPAEPYRKRVIQALLDRLDTISMANGFATEAGACVMVGEIAIASDDADVAIAVVPGETAPLGERTINKVAESLPITVAALARAESWDQFRDAWMRVEDVLADIKEAIETDDATLGGLLQGDLRRGSTVTLEREEGGTTVGAAITYDAVYATGWGMR